jgi:DNA recombination protein RmuC
MLLLLIIIIILLLKLSSRKEDPNTSDLRYKLDSLTGEMARIESAVRNEISLNRSEANTVNKDSREEITRSLYAFAEQLSGSMKENATLQKQQLELFSGNLNNLTKSVEEKLQLLTVTVDNKLKDANEANAANAKDSRRELRESLETFKTDFSKSVQDFGTAQKDQNTTTTQRLDQLRDTLEKKLSELQAGNEKKLEEMRNTVDEKLQKTLESRLGESFKLVSERLEAVHKGLGDMQQLATGVGDLKRVLTNVKSRGVLGEYQLESILDHILTPDQYAKNVKTKEGSNALVEFAVKLPAKDDKQKILWLPIDSKFPKEDFELLVDAYDRAIPEEIEEHRKNFVKGIKKCAFDISSKYIDPPNTTDFAILFLPFESLYAEVLRTVGLFESLQREYKIIITGPTTLSALLSSFQMGFRTLAIEKRSSEVWQLLGAVKTEFGTFGGILDKTQKKLQEASNVIEQAGVRSRAIEKKLRNVQELPREQASDLIGDIMDADATEEAKEE